MEIVANMMVSGRPPQRPVSTSVSPMTPPPISMKNAAMTTIQATTSQGFQKVRVQLATNSATIKRVATKGRHCSSNG